MHRCTEQNNNKHLTSLTKLIFSLVKLISSSGYKVIKLQIFSYFCGVTAVHFHTGLLAT